jgi:hypothetical protein
LYAGEMKKVFNESIDLLLPNVVQTHQQMIIVPPCSPERSDKWFVSTKITWWCSCLKGEENTKGFNLLFYSKKP